MSAFPDTSFLCALYRQQGNSPQAAKVFQSLSGALPASSLLLLEFRQSTRLQVWLHGKDKLKGFSRVEADRMLAILEQDIKDGHVEVQPVDWADVHAIAERLSHDHTWSEGNRGFDILHVATALHLNAKEFLSFDAQQRKLAEAEGLRVLP